MAVGHIVFTKFRPPGKSKPATLRLYLQIFICILNRWNRNCTATDAKLIAVVMADTAALKPRTNWGLWVCDSPLPWFISEIPLSQGTAAGHRSPPQRPPQARAASRPALAQAGLSAGLGPRRAPRRPSPPPPARGPLRAPPPCPGPGLTMAPWIPRTLRLLRARDTPHPELAWRPRPAAPCGTAGGSGEPGTALTAHRGHGNHSVWPGKELLWRAPGSSV